ncbi:MAG: helix-turn-helix transcriptional regulator [Eubacterium sp.]
MKNRIKSLRKYKNMTQEEFAKRIGLARNSVTSYEIGRREPTNAIINSICREFNVNEDWLRHGSGDMFIKTQVNELSELRRKYNLDDLDIKIITEYLKLQPEQRKVFKIYLNNIVGSTAMEPQDEIEIKTAAYRRELEDEKHIGTSSVSPNTGEGKKEEKIS